MVIPEHRKRTWAVSWSLSSFSLSSAFCSWTNLQFPHLLQRCEFSLWVFLDWCWYNCFTFSVGEGKWALLKAVCGASHFHLIWHKEQQVTEVGACACRLSSPSMIDQQGHSTQQSRLLGASTMRSIWHRICLQDASLTISLFCLLVLRTSGEMDNREQLPTDHGQLRRMFRDDLRDDPMMEKVARFLNLQRTSS